VHTWTPCSLKTLALKVVNATPQVHKQAILEFPSYFVASLKIQPIIVDALKDVVWAKLKHIAIDELRTIIFFAPRYDPELGCVRDRSRPTILARIAFVAKVYKRAGSSYYPVRRTDG
jgi:hypothetical protein